jgi:hypothetical protein
MSNKMVICLQTILLQVIPFLSDGSGEPSALGSEKPSALAGEAVRT